VDETGGTLAGKWLGRRWHRHTEQRRQGGDAAGSEPGTLLDRPVLGFRDAVRLDLAPHR
jgi:hypothetical protein